MGEISYKEFLHLAADIYILTLNIHWDDTSVYTPMIVHPGAHHHRVSE